MQAKNQLLFTMIKNNGGYHLRSKKEKTKLLDEYCRITGQNRKAVIRKIRSGQYVKSMRKEKGEKKVISGIRNQACGIISLGYESH